MALLSTSVRVRVPATSANLGPGFDSLGLALDRYDEVTARVAPGDVVVEVTGEGAGQLPTGDDHLVVRAMRAAFDALSEPLPGLELSCANAIPQARGMGSSSAAIVAGLLLARELVVDGARRLPDPAVLALASALEGHPDNVAPCLLGGFTIAWTENGEGRAVRLDPHPSIRPVVYVPATRGLTAEARAALPERVPHGDAAFNAGRAALLVHAVTSDPALLLTATEDRLHQDYRAPGMPHTAELVATLRAAGVPAVVSGAGPTVLAFVVGDGALPDVGDTWKVWKLGVADAGASIVAGTMGHAERDPVAAGRES
ncbi:homoserine kinase [Virgisporangium aliadipatigenens]|uniref:Homoserine kinase n=1 Tax=Virgisporangium aliadipatigenens TaxID=741659 RepID=A0A8J4DTE2_9ACTN|nr:homoserine kinase [Virgisporangium aliadipatigenens]GIJ48868.1 homoserine kinase [Virgisporangium aliadipatigenens]